MSAWNRPRLGLHRLDLPWLARRSLATRLFLSAVFLSTTILLVAGLILSEINVHSSEQDFDERLGVYVRALVADVANGEEARNGAQLGEPLFELPLSGWYWQVTRLDTPKPEIRASKSLFNERLPQLAQAGIPVSPGGLRRGYAEGPDNRRLRIVERFIDAGDDGRFLVQVAASPEEIEAHIDGFNLSLGLTFTLLGLALAGSTALQLRFGLRPLRRMREGVSAIRRGESERLDGRFPPDLAPLAGELNLLIASNREIVERARTQVGNLAHALKTPISVLVNEADLADGAGTDEGLPARVREQTGLMRDQVAYYLDRARAAARVSVIGTATDVAPAVAALLRTFGKIYVDRDLRFHSDVPEGLRFRGERQDFDELVGNLVDNAGKWAGALVQVGAAVQADPETGDTALLITIDDDGPGLPAEARDAATRRGRRLDESKPGSGLGLSIVTDLAGAYGGGLQLHDSPCGGLRAVLHLPGGVTDFRPNPVQGGTVVHARDRV